MDIHFKAKKILFPMASFELVDSLPADIANLSFQGHLIGIYENGEHPKDRIIITETELVHIKKESIINIRFEDITNIGSPETKESEPVLSLSLRNGKNVFLPIKNGNGKCKDVYEFQRFLMRVVERRLFVPIS